MYVNDTSFISVNKRTQRSRFNPNPCDAGWEQVRRECGAPRSHGDGREQPGAAVGRVVYGDVRQDQSQCETAVSGTPESREVSKCEPAGGRQDDTG